MKKIFLMIILALVCGAVLSSCDESTDTDGLEGTYVGTYTWKNLTRDFLSSSTPIIELKGGKYTYKDLSLDNYYNNGYGNYTIHGDKIVFELTNYDIPMECIGVVEEWLLQGEYKYKFDGDKLIFSKEAFIVDDKYSYEFEVKKTTNR